VSLSQVHSVKKEVLAGQEQKALATLPVNALVALLTEFLVELGDKPKSGFVKRTLKSKVPFIGDVEKLRLLVSHVDVAHLQPALRFHYEIGRVGTGTDGVSTPCRLRQPTREALGYSVFRSRFWHGLTRTS
jgi:hypothetical protein